jgi:flagellar biosynthesis protein FlhB
VSPRTEPPTPRRLRQARLGGEAARGSELAAAAALAGGLAALTLAGPAIASGLAAHLRTSLAGAVRGEADPGRALAASLAALLRAAAPLVAGALAPGLLAGLAASGFLFAPAAAAPRLERLDPGRGLARLLAPETAAQASLGMARAAVALAAALGFLAGAAPALSSLPRLDVAGVVAALPALAASLAWPLAALLLLAGLGDLALSRMRHRRALRMTRAEVIRERRDEEGDPLLRAERRRLQAALSAAPPLSRAAVVVVNPTHLAVALSHRRGSDAAPVVLAKGSGREAARLRARARRAGVPVVRDPALARSLWRLAGVGEAIPEELYQAAAALLVEVHRLGREALA